MRPKFSAVLCILLSLAGIGLCAYLGFIHVALLRGEFLGGAACSTSGIFNCHAVTGGTYGSFLGVPVALWGLLGYLATFTLALIAWQFPEWTAKALSAIASLALLFLVLDAGLLAVMVTKIRYLCPLCLASYAVNLLLLLVARAGAAQPWRQLLQVLQHLLAWRPQPRVPVTWILWGVVLTGAMGTSAVMASVKYMQQGAPGALRLQIHKFLKEQKRARVDVTGDPAILAPRQAVQVVEFSDFLCPSCQRASKFTPIILASHRDDVSFVFKHFPLDSSCNSTITRVVHPNACELAAATECAHEQGKFWPLHDLIFEHGSRGGIYKPESLDRDAQGLGLDMAAFRSCRESGRGMEAVKRDVAEAARLNITSTPSFFVNGLPVVGVLSPPMFEEFFRTLKESGS